ncbi:MAG: hypothetical protein IJK43_14565, partial [Prevotella sp.]|nr:hypothetical protein [Prevotella sp.]
VPRYWSNFAPTSNAARRVPTFTNESFWLNPSSCSLIALLLFFQTSALIHGKHCIRFMNEMELFYKLTCFVQ